jgi:hypothetical protein
VQQVEDKKLQTTIEPSDSSMQDDDTTGDTSLWKNIIFLSELYSVCQKKVHSWKNYLKSGARDICENFQ